MTFLQEYLNPIARLGNRDYSIFFPLTATLSMCLVVEFVANVVVHDPNAVGVYAIFIFVALIIYFAFRDGLRGGWIATGVTIFYYFYIIYTRNYQGEVLESGLQTTGILAVLYLFLGGVIGGLKQKIDALIEKEADGRQRLESIVQQLPVGVVVVDKSGIVEMANKRADEILGVTIPVGFQSGSGTIVETKVNGRLINGSQSLIVQAMNLGKPIVNREYEIVRPDGRLVNLQASASIIKNSEGKIIAGATIFADVTAHREMESKKDDFVNMASHELKTPITSMKLYMGVLNEKIKVHKDENINKIVGSIDYQMDRLQKLVSDLLDVSRLQTGKMSFSKEEFRIDKMLLSTVDELRHLANNKIFEVNVKTPIKIFADKLRIYQVITNLITNAIKYSPDSEIIKISAKKDGKSVVVSVQDFGIGIDKLQLTKIFERLYQVNDDRGKTFPGFGMGLYISKAIILRHKGKIWVESEMGKGSTFYFTLPTR